MKKLVLLSFCALFTAAANAGVVKFSAKHIVKPAAKTTFHAAKFSTKKATAGTVKAVKLAKKAVF